MPMKSEAAMKISASRASKRAPTLHSCMTTSKSYTVPLHHSRGQSRDVKKMQDETEGAMKISASRASKLAPTWHSCTITPKSLSGQPLDRVWIRLARKRFGATVKLCHVGARFEALDALVFMAPSVSPYIFNYVPRLPSGTMWKGLFSLVNLLFEK